MGTYDYTRQNGGKAVSTQWADRIKLMREVITLSEVATAVLPTGTTAFSAEDIIQLYDIPIDHMVREVMIKVTTAESSTMTLDFGEDTSHADGLDDGINAETAGWHRTGPDDDYGTATGKGLGYLTTAADTLDMVIKTVGAQSSHTLVFRLLVWVMDLS